MSAFFFQLSSKAKGEGVQYGGFGVAWHKLQGSINLFIELPKEKISCLHCYSKNEP